MALPSACERAGASTDAGTLGGCPVTEQTCSARISWTGAIPPCISLWLLASASGGAGFAGSGWTAAVTCAGIASATLASAGLFGSLPALFCTCAITKSVWAAVFSASARAFVSPLTWRNPAGPCWTKARSSSWRRAGMIATMDGPWMSMIARVRSPAAGGLAKVPMLTPPRASAIWGFVAMNLASDTGARVLMTNSSLVSTRSRRIPARYRSPAEPVTAIPFRLAGVVPRPNCDRKSAACWGVISFNAKTLCSPRTDCLLALEELASQPAKVIPRKAQRTIHPAYFAPQHFLRFILASPLSLQLLSPGTRRARSLPTTKVLLAKNTENAKETG
jgi:hypothetical protein